MKFAHLADMHLGAYKELKMRALSEKAFELAINKILEEKVDFVVISGDLFNTSLPAVDNLKDATLKLKLLKDNNIPVYIIAGSHDFSPSGKTMLDVLENAGLAINVAKGEMVNDKLRLRITEDPKTKAKLCGIIGKKGMLEKSYYEILDRDYLEQIHGFKIFLLHTALTELKPSFLEDMESYPISFLPKGFDYYAAGHVHVRDVKSFDGYKNIVYPGPLFPNNFREIERELGGFYIYDDGNLRHIPLNVVEVSKNTYDCNHKSPEQVREEILTKFENTPLNNTLVLLRLYGTLESGKPSDIDFKSIYDSLYKNGTYFILKNISKLEFKQFDEVKTNSSSIEELERTLIIENIGQIKMPSNFNEVEMINQLIVMLTTEKKEGEKKEDFERRIIGDVDGVF